MNILFVLFTICSLLAYIYFYFIIILNQYNLLSFLLYCCCNYANFPNVRSIKASSSIFVYFYHGVQTLAWCSQSLSLSQNAFCIHYLPPVKVFLSDHFGEHFKTLNIKSKLNFCCHFSVFREDWQVSNLAVLVGCFLLVLFPQCHFPALDISTFQLFCVFGDNRCHVFSKHPQCQPCFHKAG